MATPGLLETMGVPRIAGSDFGAETATGPKTAIVNQAFVRRLGPGRDPIGLQVTGGGATYRIIGVMLESNLVAGAQKQVAGQPLVRGQSMTDACIGWDETLPLLRELAAAAHSRG